MVLLDRNFMVTCGKEKIFIVNKGRGNKHRFIRSERGLYNLDTSSTSNNSHVPMKKEGKSAGVRSDNTRKIRIAQTQSI